jgi:hypothetical protein
MPHPRIPTLPAHRSADEARRGRALRRLGMVALTLLVVAGLLSWLGVRSATVTATRGGHTLTVTYPQVTRAGVATPFEVLIERPGGFDQAVTLGLPRQLVARFDFQNWYPNPRAETGGPGYVYLTFDPPPGDVFAVSADVRTSADQNGSIARHRVAVIYENRPAVEVSFRMVVVP